MATISIEINEADLCSINVKSSQLSLNTQIVIDSEDAYLCLDIDENRFETLLRAMLVYQFKASSTESSDSFLKRAIAALEAVDGVDKHGRKIDIQQSALFRAIIGGLKAAINDHGDISSDKVENAAKRIYGLVESIVYSEANA